MKKETMDMLLSDHPWLENLHCFDCIDSTNTAAKHMAQKGAPHGTVLIADQQTQGRGRMGRSFCSPAGMGIYLSVVLRPACTADQLMHLTCAVAVAMCDAVEKATGFRPGIKWINDLVAGGKKLGGILTEMSISPSTGNVDFAIVGIGINCNQKTGDFPTELENIAVSLSDITGKTIDRNQLVAAMIDALWNMDRELFTKKADRMNQYKADCTTLGNDVFLLRGGEKIPCHALDLDPDGALIVQYPDHSKETVSSGEVSVRMR